MLGSGLLRVRLLKISRRKYNSTQFRKAARYSRITQLIFRDRESLDILARSYLRIKNYDGACKAYRKANKNGFALLDHEINHFRSELGAQNYQDAFIALQRVKGREQTKKCTSQLKKELLKITDSERVLIIQEMSSIHPLPREISELLPWSPRKIDYEKTETDDFGIIDSKNLDSERYKRKLSRVLSSGTYRVSEHLSKSLKSPLRTIFLPISTPFLILDIFRERIGSISASDNSVSVPNSVESRRDSIVFFPTNGVGFGHFTRLLAIARKIRESQPSTEIVFFTTMPTLHILAEEGFVCYHMPGRYRYKGMEAKSWNAMCEEMLSLIFSLHKPSAFVFDGSFPYRGMLDAVKSETKSMLRLWVRRGAIRRGSKPIPVDSIGHFHAIIRPGDSVQDSFVDETRHNIPIVRSQPILLESNSGDKQTFGIRKRLGIPDEAILCYVQLGAGKINDIDSELEMTLDALDSYSQTYVLLGESMLGSRIPVNYERVRVLRDYPNSKYFDEIDFAVIAGGYNSYHEVVSSELPSLCYPNMNTGRDDQLARANIAKEANAMVVIERRTKEKIRLGIMRMMDSKNREKMRNSLVKLKRKNGANEVSEWIINQI